MKMYVIALFYHFIHREIIDEVIESVKANKEKIKEINKKIRALRNEIKYIKDKFAVMIH